MSFPVICVICKSIICWTHVAIFVKIDDWPPHTFFRQTVNVRMTTIKLLGQQFAAWPPMQFLSPTLLTALILFSRDETAIYMQMPLPVKTVCRVLGYVTGFYSYPCYSRRFYWVIPRGDSTRLKTQSAVICVCSNYRLKINLCRLEVILKFK